MNTEKQNIILFILSLLGFMTLGAINFLLIFYYLIKKKEILKEPIPHFVINTINIIGLLFFFSMLIPLFIFEFNILTIFYKYLSIGIGHL